MATPLQIINRNDQYVLFGKERNEAVTMKKEENKADMKNTALGFQILPVLEFKL